MRRITTSALLLAGLALGACGPVNRGLESVNQPVVSRSDFAFDLSSDGLRSPSSAEARRLAAWFDAIDLAYGDSVGIDDPSPYEGAAARDTIAAVLAERGLLLSSDVPTTTGAIAPGNVRVVVSRTAATVPNCPNWKRPSQPEYAGSTMSNYGCAVNGNLAAMIANPEDLVRGRNAEATDSRSVTKAIKTYRDAPTSGAQGLKNETTKGQ